MSKTVENAKNINVKEVIEKTVAKTEKTTFVKFIELVATKNPTEKTVENAIALYNELNTKDKTTENVEKIEKLIALVNADFKSKVVAKYVTLNNAELLNALCNVTVKTTKKDTVKTIAKKLQNAIDYKVISIKNDKGTLTKKDGTKGLTIDDVFLSKSQIIANKKADNTITKDDKKVATLEIIDNTTKGVLYCMLHTACKINNISDYKIIVTDEYNKVYNALKLIFEQQKKENPFDKISNRSLEKQLAVAVSTVLNTTNYDNKVKTSYVQMFLNMIVSTDKNNGLQVEANNMFKVLQSLIVVCRYMYNNIAPMYQHNSTIHTAK